MPRNTSDDILAVIWQAAIGLAAILLIIAVARYIRRRMVRAPFLSARDPSIAALVSNLAFVGVIAVGVVTVLPSVGVQITPLITVLGVSGLAVSLALQDVLRNFVAGIYILLEKPFGIGDRITVRELTGEILGIDLRTTLLRTDAGLNVLVPNSVLMTEVVTSRPDRALLAYTITVSGGPEVLAEGLRPYTELLTTSRSVRQDPPPEARVDSFEGDTVAVGLRFRTADWGSGVTGLVRQLQERYPEATVTAKVES